MQNAPGYQEAGGASWEHCLSDSRIVKAGRDENVLFGGPHFISVYRRRARILAYFSLFVTGVALVSLPHNLGPECYNCTNGCGTCLSCWICSRVWKPDSCAYGRIFRFTFSVNLPFAGIGHELHGVRQC